MAVFCWGLPRKRRGNLSPTPAKQNRSGGRSRAETLFDPSRNGIQRGREGTDIRSTALGKIGAATALAADLGRHMLHEIASLDAPGQILGHAGHEHDFSVFLRRQ